MPSCQKRIFFCWGGILAINKKTGPHVVKTPAPVFEFLIPSKENMFPVENIKLTG